MEEELIRKKEELAGEQKTRKRKAQDHGHVKKQASLKKAHSKDLPLADQTREQSEGSETEGSAAAQATVDISYDPQRYDEVCSPMCVLVPHRDVLFKMMKACVGVEKVQDLWMYNESIEERLAFQEERAKKKKEILPFYFFF